MQEVDEVLVLNKGRQVFLGPPESATENAYLQELVEEVSMQRE